MLDCKDKFSIVGNIEEVKSAMIISFVCPFSFIPWPSEEQEIWEVVHPRCWPLSFPGCLGDVIAESTYGYY